MAPPAAASLPDVPVSRVSWNPCVRIVSTRYPPIAFFEAELSPEELAAAEALIAGFDQTERARARASVGRLDLVAAADRVGGAGAGYVMAAFTYPAPGGARFTDGTYGAYYAANDEATAIAETRFHNERFLAARRTPPTRLDVRVLHAAVDTDLHDIRGLQMAHPDLYQPDPDRYAVSQAFGRTLRASGANGIVYDSVRHPGGQCVALFRPRLVTRCRRASVLSYAWDGKRIAHVYEMKLWSNE